MNIEYNIEQNALEETRSQTITGNLIYNQTIIIENNQFHNIEYEIRPNSPFSKIIQ
jgi:hypothetical protein